VADDPGDLEDVRTLRDQLRDREVPQVVDAQVRQAGCLAGGVELAADPEALASRVPFAGTGSERPGLGVGPEDTWI
jgi:hypothetical protein